MFFMCTFLFICTIYNYHIYKFIFLDQQIEGNCEYLKSVGFLLQT